MRVPQHGDVRCAGFRIELAAAGDEPRVRLTPGEHQLREGVTSAVLRGLTDAPRLVAAALRIRTPPLPFDRVEVALQPGELADGEALALGGGVIRIRLGEHTSREDAERLARHEAVHLLLARTLAGGPRWNDPELALAEWIVRGIESGLDPALPRFHAPPPLVETPPRSRGEVRQHLALVDGAPSASKRYFGEALHEALVRVAAGGAEHAERRRLWLVEAALGTHFVEAAARVNDVGEQLVAVLLDDWLLDYEHYARALGNPPGGTGHAWALSDPGWSRDPAVRLSAAAQALQAADASWFADVRGSEPVVWKNRGRVRVPIVEASPRAHPPPVQTFRAVLRGMDCDDDLRLVEQAARGAAQGFEARVLWPRILARLIARGPSPELELRSPAVVQIVEGAGAESAFAAWTRASNAISAVTGATLEIIAARHVATLAHAGLERPSVLVDGAPATAETLAAARTLAARHPVRASLFRDRLAPALEERLPDFPAARDPRHRAATWSDGPVPSSPAELVAQVDEATRDGRLTTPVSFLLSLLGAGIEESLYLLSDTDPTA